ISVDGGSPETGTIVFSSEDLDGGSVNAAYSAASPALGNAFQSDDADAADDLAAALNASGNALTAESDYYSDVVTIEWNDVGERDDISATEFPTVGDAEVTVDVTQQGADAIDMEAG